MLKLLRRNQSTLYTQEMQILECSPSNALLQLIRESDRHQREFFHLLTSVWMQDEQSTSRLRLNSAYEKTEKAAVFGNVRNKNFSRELEMWSNVRFVIYDSRCDMIAK